MYTLLFSAGKSPVTIWTSPSEGEAVAALNACVPVCVARNVSVTLPLSALDELTVDADPASNLGGASEGDLAYDTTDNQLQAFDGTNWLAVYSGSVTPSLDQVTDVGYSTTNGIDVGRLTVNSAFILPTTTGLPGQVLTVSTTTSELVFKNSGLPTGTANGDIIHYNGTGEGKEQTN